MLLEFPGRVSYKSVKQECRRRSVKQEVSSKSVTLEVFHKSVK